MVGAAVTPVPFQGTCVSDVHCELGEGPTYDPAADIVWWFDIKGRRLREWRLGSDEKKAHHLPLMASALAVIDPERQLLVTEKGLMIREVATGRLSPHVVVDDDPATRSNDSRVHPSGALWTSRMGRHAEHQAGGIYHISKSRVTLLYSNITIPNGICFSPDGGTAYFVDSRINHYMRVSVDPATGLPTGEPSMLVDAGGRPGCVDGAVTDAEGLIWYARWGDGSVDVLQPDGTLVARHAFPARQVSCPVFVGSKASCLLVTTAWEDMNVDARLNDPEAGRTFALGGVVKGRHDATFRL